MEKEEKGKCQSCQSQYARPGGHAGQCPVVEERDGGHMAGCCDKKWNSHEVKGRGGRGRSKVTC